MDPQTFISSLPAERYRTLVGTCICAFNQNHGVIVENILEVDDGRYNWYDLINLTSGRISERARRTIAQKCGGDEIPDLFDEIILLRNNIAHSFQGVDEAGQPVLRRKAHSGHRQFSIDEAYMQDFLAKNARLAQLLQEFNAKHRDYEENGGEDC